MRYLIDGYNLLYALGWYTPIFHVIYDVLPGVDLFRRPTDATFIVGLMIAAARQPIRRPFQRHVLSRAFSASTTGRGVTRYNVRPSTV